MQGRHLLPLPVVLRVPQVPGVQQVVQEFPKYKMKNTKKDSWCM